MARVKKADFYFGSVLSVMLSNGVKPALFEESDKRRIYTFSTNKAEYQMYMKYASAPTKRQKKDVQLWQFYFSADEIEGIKSFEDNGKKILFVLICAKKQLKDTEIAVLDLDQAKSCLGIDFKRDKHRITVKYEKGAHGLKVYGTGRADILNATDNTITISRDIISGL